jgi:hypothetical protein
MKLASAFLDDVKRSSFLPCNQLKFNDADLIAFTNEELQQNVWADLVLLGEEFLLVTDLLKIKSSTGHQNYPANIVPIPKRAYARAVREIKIVSTADLIAGKEPDKQDVPWITMEHAERFVGNQEYDREDGGVYGCFFISDGIKFSGDFKDSDETLEIRYVVAPPVVESSATLHGDVNQLLWDSTTSTASLVVSSVGTDLNAYCGAGATKLFDVYRKSSGALLYANVPLTRSGTSFSTTQLAAADLVQIATFQQGGFTGALNTLTSGYEAEIMIVASERTNYIPLNTSMINRLQAHVVQRVLAAQGDTEMLSVEINRTKESAKKLEQVQNDRYRGGQKTIPMNNGLLNAIRRQTPRYGRQ